MPNKSSDSRCTGCQHPTRPTERKPELWGHRYPCCGDDCGLAVKKVVETSHQRDRYKMTRNDRDSSLRRARHLTDELENLELLGLGPVVVERRKLWEREL